MFHFKAHQTTVKKELLAAFTTFLTISYIVIIVPDLLARTGMSIDITFTAICLIAAFGSILCGLVSNLPIGLAPGLSLTGYFVYVVVGQLGFPWETALGAVFISGVIFLIITVTKIRQYILDAIPPFLSIAIIVGIGIFLGLIALKNVGIIVANPATLVKLGNMHTPQIWLFLLGFFFITILDHKNVKGALLIGILIITVVDHLITNQSLKGGVIGLPHFTNDYVFALNIKSLFHVSLIPVIFAFVLIALFDSTGSLLGLIHNISYLTPPEQRRKMNQALFAESITTITSSLLGMVTAIPFLENATGIRAGGRTGLTAIFTGIFFLAALFFAPLVHHIPTSAVSAALLYVSCLMLKTIRFLEWNDYSEFIPACICFLMIPLTFSVADGVGLGIITTVILKASNNGIKKIHPFLWILAGLFAVYFIFI